MPRSTLAGQPAGPCARIRPTVLALVELELWPNLIRAAKQSGAKVAIINARLSARSYRGYRDCAGRSAPTLRRIDVVAAQDADYARRFVDLGSPRETGSASPARSSMTAWRATGTTPGLASCAGSWASRRPTWSSWPEARWRVKKPAALAAYRAARRAAPEPAAGPCPPPRRAIRRGGRVAGENGRVRCVAPQPRRAGSGGPGSKRPSAVILIDTIGELAAVWGLADVAFVGGSLLPGRGGQNMMEPAAYGASVMFGPHTANFRETVEQLLARATPLAGSPMPTSSTCGSCEDLDDPETAAARGEAGRAFVLAQHGASGRTLAELDRLVESSLLKSRLEPDLHFELRS